MKRIISAIMLMLILAGAAFAVDPEEYRVMKERNKRLAEAEQQMYVAYGKLLQVTPATRRREVRENQKEWLNVGRDVAAINYMSEGYSPVKAYMTVMNDRVKELTRLYNMYSVQKRNGSNAR